MVEVVNNSTSAKLLISFENRWNDSYNWYRDMEEGVWRRFTFRSKLDNYAFGDVTGNGVDDLLISFENSWNDSHNWYRDMEEGIWRRFTFSGKLDHYEFGVF